MEDIFKSTLKTIFFWRLEQSVVSYQTTTVSTSDSLEHWIDTGGEFLDDDIRLIDDDDDITDETTAHAVYLLGKVLARLCYPGFSRKLRQEISTTSTHLSELTIRSIDVSFDFQIQMDSNNDNNEV